jgi:hypothetical protein
MNSGKNLEHHNPHAKYETFSEFLEDFGNKLSASK